MGVIINFFSQVLINNEERRKKKDDKPLLLSEKTGRPLNPLYNPDRRPTKDMFIECEKIMHKFMTGLGYRKYLAGNNIPRPKRRFLKKSERMEVGDQKTMFRVTKFKK